QQVRLCFERAAGDGHDFCAGCENGAAERGQFSFRAAAGQQARAGRAEWRPPATRVPGRLRGAAGAPGGPPPRNTDNDVWAADIHMTPNGKFLYITERTSHTLAGFSVDGASGKITYLGSTPTERQPRGFAIDPKGRFLVASGEKSDTVSVY